MMQPAKKRRQSRHKRSPRPHGMVLQTRDANILVAIFLYRFMTRSQIQVRFGIRCVTIATRLLRRLFDNGYLDRRFQPVVTGSSEAIYFLGKKGIPIVADRLQLDPDLVKLRRRRNLRLRVDRIEHDLKVNDFRIDLIRHAARHHLKVKRWLEPDECSCRFDLSVDGRQLHYFLKPDGYFELSPAAPVSGYFVEIDYGSCGLKKLKSKFQTYLTYLRKDGYRLKFGGEHFYVLVVTTTASRAKHLRELAHELKGGIILVTTFEVLRGHGPFADIWTDADGSDIRLIPAAISQEVGI